jgi:prephenate dehydrogenase
MLSSVRIVGSGLIGTSIGLCLKAAGINVEMVDIDPNTAKLAQDLVKSTPISNPDLIIVAVSIDVNQSEVIKQLNANQSSIVCDLASVKSDLLLKVAELSDNAANFVSLHPMAGREMSGAQSARADLFTGRAWIAIDENKSSKKAKEIVSELISICGGSVYWMSAAEHDEIVAKISHIPQILSTALAASLLNISEEKLNLSGQGLRDLTRLADADSKLWSQILLENRERLTPIISELVSQLEAVQENLSQNSAEKMRDFLSKGKSGKAKIPGKHGAKAREYSFLPIVIDDKPGELARIFNECAKAAVNIEDLSIEHSPGQETGLITLALSSADCVKLSDHLEKLGFKVHPAKNR